MRKSRVLSGSDRSRKTFSSSVRTVSFRCNHNCLILIFLDPVKIQVAPAVSDWSVKMTWQLWSHPVYGNQLGFINLSLLVWIILEIQNTLIHSVYLNMYTLFLMTWVHLHTQGGRGGKRNGKLMWFSSLLVCVCFLHVCKIFHRYRHLKTCNTRLGHFQVYFCREPRACPGIKKKKSLPSSACKSYFIECICRTDMWWNIMEVWVQLNNVT